MELSAGGSHELEYFSDFSITVTLTKKGLANYQKVIAAIFKYAQRLRDGGAQEWVFEEKKKIGQMQFEFLEKGDPIHYCVGLAR
jgi:secreted Zn-dependent insulinase-like peptidase